MPSGVSGVAQAGRVPVDVVLLNLGLPGVDGGDVTGRLRCEHPDLLIVTLTARSDDIDVIAKLHASADDYLDLVVNTAARRCLVRGRELQLRLKEFDLLEVLARHAERAVAREELMARVWDENWFGSTKPLDVTVASLRRRLRDAVAGVPGRVRVPVIETRRGHDCQPPLLAPATAEEA
ncbi:response regulator transcription factor [Kitasatospora sp. NPDC093679]|uniref:response regulator transcription factor n=1 Tax=Kitasatospora sp. NPDC093679 TaxID=3154983 RepID=UPI003439DAB5